MPRRSTGAVVERRTKRGVVYALRFYAAGERRYETLGSDGDGWNRRKAEDELAAVMAAIRAGTWGPRVAATVSSSNGSPDPTFHEFASEWFSNNRAGWAERTVSDYQWALTHHLLPYFAEYPLRAITVEEVDRYRGHKLREGKLAPAQVNKTLKRLSQVLEVADEYGRIDHNPARGKRRRAIAPKVQRSWVEPEQAMSLIEGGSTYMRPVIATLIGAGLRVSEATALDWSDVNLATGTLRVGRAKTDAGSFREVDLSGGLVEELTEWRLRCADVLAEWEGEGEPLFLSRHAGRVRRQSAANVARRLKTAIKAANKRLGERGIEPISERVTPHSLRRTFASLRAALREDPVYISEQMGHKDARFTLNVYTKATKRRAKLHGAYLAEYERALAWAALAPAERALMGTGGTHTPQAVPVDLA